MDRHVSTSGALQLGLDQKGAMSFTAALVILQTVPMLHYLLPSWVTTISVMVHIMELFGMLQTAPLPAAPSTPLHISSGPSPPPPLTT